MIYELRLHQIELEMQNVELRRTKQELEDSRARYFDLYNLAPVGYCTIDRQGVILEANLTAASQLGVARDAMVKQPISRFIVPADHDAHSRYSAELFGSGRPQNCELRLQRPDAAFFWARLEGNLTHGIDDTLCRIVISDITARKLMAETLRKSEEKYRTVANFTYDWEFWLGPNGDFWYCSPSCQRITGHSAAAFEKDPSLLRALVHPDDLANFDRHNQAAKDQEIGQEFEFRIIRADGLIRWAWLAHVCQPVYDDKGQFMGIRGSNRDVTSRKHLEAQVAKDQNLASLGVLASGIAHDFNNLFQGLFGNLALAKMYTEKSSRAFTFLENAEHVYGLAAKLTSQLIAFSEGNFAIPEDIEPAALIREETIATLNGSGLIAEFGLADGLWQIKGDPNQFRAVIKHIVRNAMDAISSGPGSKVIITSVNETLQERHCTHPTLAPGKYVRISIQDHGCGISRECLPRIFDPYYSTKQRGSQKGMGLGLALCDTIIKKHGGAIMVKSKPGSGTTFHVYLPASVRGAMMTETKKDYVTQGPRILLMDDDSAVLQVTTKFLNLSGYRVDSTMDGDAAIKAYQEAHAAGDPYKVVILDLTIPE
ncbi:MAG: PAS domain S-box protein, partial [Aeromonas bestiarum]